VGGGLLADAVVARLARDEADARQRPQRGVHLDDLARERPGAIHDDDVAGRVVPQRGGLHRALAGEEDVGAGLGGQRADARVVLELHAVVELRVGQRQVRHPRRADRDAPLARVLKEDDVGARLHLVQLAAVADGLRPQAAEAERAERLLGGR